MTVQEAIDYINAHTWSQWKLGLSRTRDLLALLGDPQKQLRFVHVAGSNGKGSTCAMVERILREAGYVTGFYPSPYIEDFRERIQVCGQYIGEEDLCRITERVASIADGMEDHPTQFELITAIGMVYFAEKKCDLVVLEVGLGGTFDSTNIIDPPEVAVITRIGLEHTEYLGNTLAEIAANKSGIIKPGSDVVCYENEPEVMEVVRRVCMEKGCPLHIARFDRILPVEESLEGQTFYYLAEAPGESPAAAPGPVDGTSESEEGRELFHLSLTGAYQLHNAATALTVVEALRGRGFEIPAEAVRLGLERVQWPARFEVLSRQPLFILDGGHNPQCAEALAESIRRYLPDQAGSARTGGGIVFLLGMLADKDYRAVIDTISPYAAAFVCLTPDSPRALPAQDLAVELEKRGFQAIACGTAREGIETALGLAEALRASEEPGAERPLPAVISFGSLYMAGAVRTAFPAARESYITSCKKRQRKEAVQRRRSLTEEERTRKSARICRLAGDLEEIRKARTIFSYASAPDEACLDALNRSLEEEGKTVCYPLCLKKGIMKAVIPAPGDPEAWRTGAYGIREPVAEKAVTVDPSRIDAVLVPCVAFDKKGGRCGHGAGYYDRFLTLVSPETPKILVAFDAQETETLAMEETDIRMDLAVTESGVLRF